MKQQISGTPFSEAKLGLWTPWGILRLPETEAEPDNTGREQRRRLAGVPLRPLGGERSIRARDREPLS